MTQRDWLAENDPPEYEDQLFPTVKELEAEAERQSHLFLKTTGGSEDNRLSFMAGWLLCDMAHMANKRVYLAEAMARIESR